MSGQGVALLVVALAALAQVPGGAIDGFIVDAAEEAGIDPELVAAVVWVESYGDPTAVGALGERGPMQILPSTADLIEVYTGIDAEQILTDPVTNVAAGAWYLARQIERFDDVRLGLAAYNAGPGNVIECDCVPSYAAHYVDKVMAAWDSYKPDFPESGWSGLRQDAGVVVLADGRMIPQ